jgi:hypothetical protein
MILDEILVDIHSYTGDPAIGGSPYAYRFVPAESLGGDTRLPVQTGMIEVRVLYDGTYALTAVDDAGRPRSAEHPPPETDGVPVTPTRSGRPQKPDHPGPPPHPGNPNKPA